MSIVYILLFVLIALFVLAYYTKRRFGILALALCAGYLLSDMWAVKAAPLIRDAGFNLVSPPLESVVGALLILLPALCLLYGGQSYSTMIQRIIGAAGFALLAAAFLLKPLGNSIALDEMGTFYLGLLTDYKDIIITGAIAYGLIDIIIPRLPHKEKKKK